MDFLSSSVFLNLLVLLYFVLKGSILGKRRSITIPLFLSVLISLLGMYLSFLLTKNYESYKNLAYIKGSISLPAFQILFIFADSLTTIAFLFVVKHWKNIGTSRGISVQVLIEVLTMMFVYFVFSNLVQSFWFKETSKNINYDYFCFSKQVAIDLSTHYLTTGKVPEKLADFTMLEVNPSNNSALIYRPSESIVSTVIEDEAGNLIVAGYKDLVGIGVYEDTPSEFFKRFDVINESVCKGSLRIPKCLDYLCP